MRISQACLDCYKQNKLDFKYRFITIDEAWIQNYIPEKKEQSKTWIEAGGSAPKKAKTVQLFEIIAKFDWNYKEVIFFRLSCES